MLIIHQYFEQSGQCFLTNEPTAIPPKATALTNKTFSL